MQAIKQIFIVSITALLAVFVLFPLAVAAVTGVIVSAIVYFAGMLCVYAFGAALVVLGGAFVWCSEKL